MIEEVKKTFDGTLNKDDLVFKLMIRQPDFVDEAFFLHMLELTKVKKPNALLYRAKFTSISDGKCIQMMHIGSYDNDLASFNQMELFAVAHGLQRLSKKLREIYLTDFKKVPTEKLKTVLRFKAK